MYKVAINWNFGGWCLYDEHIEWLKEHGVDKETIDNMDCGYHSVRCNPMLIQCLEELPLNEDIEIIQVSKKFGYVIIDYDGAEKVLTNDPNNFIFFKEE